MSQTDPKQKQTPPPPTASKPSAPKSPSKGNAQAKGGSQALLYLSLVMLVVGAIFVINQVRNPREERPPVVSAAEEEAYVVETATASATETAPETETEAESRTPAGALIITSNVRGADVYVNDRRVGTTPHKATPLALGDYDVKVTSDGYETFEQSVRVETSEDSIHADLRPRRGASTPRAEAPPEPRVIEEEVATEEVADTDAIADIQGIGESVSVKHRHRIRSCEGILRATPRGVRYETDHQDAFAAAFADIEELDLDGDKLTLKVRDGRKYDFTVDDKNQAALAAVHARIDAQRP